MGVQNELIVILRPPVQLSKRDALIFAAWIVALADDSSQFSEILEAVQGGDESAMPG